MFIIFNFVIQQSIQGCNKIPGIEAQAVAAVFFLETKSRRLDIALILIQSARHEIAAQSIFNNFDSQHGLDLHPPR